MITNANFRFSTNILRRLGEELNPSPSQGLIELAKNAYDADALSCIIKLQNTDSPGGTIVITDDGNGMNESEIINGWLILGKSEKSVRVITDLGRRPSGDKGLGRLAALRLGTKVTLESVPIENPTKKHMLSINWDNYTDSSLVEEIDLKIVTRENDRGKAKGTRITLENLRNPLTRTEIQRLARGLILLADPFGDNPDGFKPQLKMSEYRDLETMVEAKYFKDALYHLVAEVNNDGLSSATVKDWRDQTLYLASHQDLRRKNSKLPYQCPVAQFDLWLYKLTPGDFSTRVAALPEIRKWLAAFGGVHLYYNGLRVAPYGDKDDDWLGLNLMRARAPEERPSTNNSVGRILITDSNGAMQQKTDRSGFIVNNAFQELQSFAIDSLKWMARKRLAEAEIKRAVSRIDVTKKAVKEKLEVEKAIATAPSNIRQYLSTTVEKYYDARDAEVNQLRKEIQLYRTLSTVGITSAVFAHESANNPLKLVLQSINTVQNRCMKYLADNYDRVLKKPIDRIIQSVESMRVLANVTLSLVDNEKRRASRVDIHKVIVSVLDMYHPFITDRDTNVDLELADGDPYLRGSVAAVESIISNLLNNSLVAFERKSPGERKIVIRTKVTNNELELRVLDNGPGIEGIDKEDIWLPGQTTKPNGTGLGLTIVRDAVIDLGGRVDAVEQGELGGADMIIILPILGV